jgi:single-strand DNA-binding protein
MTIKLTGTITGILDTETKKDFSFRMLHMKIDEETNYPQPIEVQFAKDKTFVLDNYSIGDKVEVEVNIRGREYNGKIYNSFGAWKINKVGAAPSGRAYQQQPVSNSVVDNEISDLPF